MKTEHFIEKFKSPEIESSSLELKSIRKLTKKDKLSFEDLLKVVVGISNNNGGYLVIGVNDDGSSEGIGIFNQFADKDKSGIDKVKEFITNTCNDRISPIISIDIEHHKHDNYEFIAISIPKMKSIPHAVISKQGNKIKGREYYIKNSHSCLEVSDTHLQWLFNGKKRSDISRTFNIDVVLYKNSFEIPDNRNIIGFGDQYISQPSIFFGLPFLMNELNSEIPEHAGIEYFSDYLIESLFFHLLMNVSMHRNMNVLTSETHSLLSYSKKEDFSILSGNFKNKAFVENTLFNINTPPLSKVESYRDGKQLIFKLSSSHVELEVKLRETVCKQGLSMSNPFYKSKVAISNGDIIEFANDYYSTYSFEVSVSSSNKFPEIYDETHFTFEKYISLFVENIEKLYDRDFFYNTLDIPQLVCQVNEKLNLILKKL